ATQANSAQIYDYDFDIHEAVIRIADSRHDSGGQLRYRGHSVGNLEAGQVADHVFTMELDGKWNADNCRLVFFVTAQEDAGVYVANAVETSALNATIEFEYK
ncbi:MAG: Omp28-related outer membrane protein, partial [Tidjanibacter sp.]|nr:Omp28-related outer membrane protein [Tidjanibacter sp.]